MYKIIMADLAGTENQKGRRKKGKRYPIPDREEVCRKTPEENSTRRP